MRIIRHPTAENLRRPVVALGTFDGVHIGHQQIIRAAVDHAKKIGAHSAVITFDPHPQEVIVPERGLRLLTTLSEREDLFCQLGVDAVVVVGFTKKMRGLAYPAFVERYLVEQLGVRQVFVGYDYAFGKGRSGDVAALKKLGETYGFGVKVVPAVKIGSRPAKSGMIRELISRGKFDRAVKILGHAYRLSGKVIRGSGRGKKIGFPTANLKMAENKLIPAQGVYFGLIDGKKCVVNIGSRPTFGGGNAQVEVHILNFSGNLRGKNIKVDLLKRFRDEKQFSDVDDLRRQIKKDIVRAREI